MPSDLEGSIEPKRGDDLLAAESLSSMMTLAVSWLASSIRSTNLMRIFSPWPSWPAAGHTEKLRPTAYLDGLRGFAAFLVYWHHHQLWAHLPPQLRTLESSFGFEGHYHFATLPGIRIFFHGGHYAVACFFVISGYVLSAKPLSHIQAGDQAKLADNLASALFRRWIRLFIPIILTTFVYMTILHAFGIWVEGVYAKPNYFHAVWDWFCELKNFSYIFEKGGPPWLTYNFHLWSIPVEFKGSIAIYTSLLAFSRCSRNARLWCEVGLIFYFLYIVDGWFCAFFTAGMLLNDLDQLAARDELPSFLDRFRPHKKAICYAMFAFSIYLGGVPVNGSDAGYLGENPGWWLLSLLRPQAIKDGKWFYLFWAAVLLVASTPHIPWLKRFFESRFCQYLGRLSFSLYLVHGPVLWTLGDRFYAAAGWPKPSRLINIPHWLDSFPLSTSGPLGLEPAFLVPHLILLPVTFYAAEIVARAIDEPSVRFPQWLYKTTTAARPATRLPA
jgi:peptidoglycan/LPS O-acetylase OafA/YrhL